MGRWFPIVAATLLASLTAQGGCAGARARVRQASDVRTVLDTALLMLGEDKVRVDGRPYRADCSGFVTAVFAAANVPIDDSSLPGRSATESIHRSLRARGRTGRGRPRPGDLLFFDNTYDRNRNGLRDDPFSHVAVVERVEEDGTVHFFHFASGRVKRDVLNLAHRSVARDPDSGKVWNAYLRRGGGRVLAGQLYRGIARPLPR